MLATISPDDGYGQAIAGGYVWKPDSCRYSLMNAEERQRCFSARNITRFLDFGDRCALFSVLNLVEVSLPVFCVGRSSHITCSLCGMLKCRNAPFPRCCQASPYSARRLLHGEHVKNKTPLNYLPRVHSSLERGISCTNNVSSPPNPGG